MAYITQLETSTLSNQNISSALLVHTFTNTARIRKIYIDIFIDAVAGGNGDYVAYITRQKAGAGNFYESIKTSKEADAATSYMLNSKPLIIGATDVVRVYILGLAADTTTPDIITEINEEYVAGSLIKTVNGLA